MTPTPSAAPAEPSDDYDLIDRFLRNNLDDADYASHSAALDRIFLAPDAPKGEHWCALEHGGVFCQICEGAPKGEPTAERKYHGQWLGDTVAGQPSPTMADAKNRTCKKCGVDCNDPACTCDPDFDTSMADAIAAGEPSDENTDEEFLRDVYAQCCEAIRPLVEAGKLPGSVVESLQILVAASSAGTPHGAREPTWRCFHCDETFTTKEAAAEHFGTRESHNPACQIDIAEYRAMEARMQRYNEEDSDLHRTMYGMQSDHQTALLREEEKGYARGLRDAVRFPDDLPAREPSEDAKDAARYRHLRNAAIPAQGHVHCIVKEKGRRAPAWAMGSSLDAIVDEQCIGQSAKEKQP